MTGVNFIPVLPFLSDSDEQMEQMVKTARDYGAEFALVGTLTLFGEGKKLYYKTLEKHFPGLVPKYKSLFRIFFAPPKEYQKELEEKSKRLRKSMASDIKSSNGYFGAESLPIGI